MLVFRVLRGQRYQQNVFFVISFSFLLFRLVLTMGQQLRKKQLFVFSLENKVLFQCVNYAAVLVRHGTVIIQQAKHQDHCRKEERRCTHELQHRM